MFSALFIGELQKRQREKSNLQKKLKPQIGTDKHGLIQPEKPGKLFYTAVVIINSGRLYSFVFIIIFNNFFQKKTVLRDNSKSGKIYAENGKTFGN